MKLIGLFVFAVATTALFSFNSGKETPSVKHQTGYTLDKETSTLGWKGGKSAAYFHTGVVKFSEGKAAMEHGALMSGEFNVDLNTIAVTDALPKEKQDGLAKHLKNEDFFNVAKFASAKVTIGAYKDGKLPTTINVMGVDIKQDIPVTVTTTDKGATITGKFDVDFTAAKIPGCQKQEGDKESISPVFSFDLNLVLKAQK